MEHTRFLEEIKLKDIQFKTWLIIAWALFWRNTIILVGSLFFAGLAGFILGFVGSFLGVPLKIGKIFSLFVGSAIGFLFIIVLLKWFFKTNFKTFKIAIIKKNSVS